MPSIRTDLENIAVQLGEAINDDVAAWDIVGERYGTVTLKLTTRDGKEYIFLGRVGNGTKAIPRVEPSRDRLKRCSKCNDLLPMSCFTRNRHAPDFHDWWCRECKNEPRRKSKERPQKASDAA